MNVPFWLWRTEIVYKLFGRATVARPKNPKTYPGVLEAVDNFLNVLLLKGTGFCLYSFGNDDGMLYLFGAGVYMLSGAVSFLSDVLPPITVPSLLVGWKKIRPRFVFNKILEKVINIPIILKAFQFTGRMTQFKAKMSTFQFLTNNEDMKILKNFSLAILGFIILTLFLCTLYFCFHLFSKYIFLALFTQVYWYLLKFCIFLSRKSFQLLKFYCNYFCTVVGFKKNQ